MTTHEAKIEQLRRQGVEIPAPATLTIDEDVELTRIRGPQTVLHAGTRLSGKSLVVAPGARLGTEGPAVVVDCAVGPRAALGSGYFAESVFLDDSSFGSGAQIRAGTLLEEQASGAHTVGLKQTVLLPFVTIGSLVNFCDVLMAGGTSRKDHSEVGSSFIHFNFTPFGRSGDKATASLIGDVPRGVLLRQRRIFLGGQAGLVGPLQIDYGTVLAAGFVYRQDHGPDELVIGEALPVGSRPFSTSAYSRIRAKVERNLRYIGNLAALWHWYDRVRLPLAAGGVGSSEILERARTLVAGNIAERISRLGQLAGYMEESVRVLASKGSKHADEVATQQAFASAWPAMAGALEQFGSWGDADTASSARAAFDRARATSQSGYLGVVAAFDDDGCRAVTRWLDGIVDRALGATALMAGKK